MEFREFIRGLPTAQLKAIKSVLEHGSLACGDLFPDKTVLNALRKENAQLQKLNERRNAVEAAGIDWDSGYWMSFKTEAEFNYFLNLFVQTREKAEKEAVAEKHSFRVPPSLFAVNDKSNVEVVRDGLKARAEAGRNGSSGEY